jgi:hypothetical protein
MTLPADRIRGRCGDKPFEGEIGVSPRVKDALSRAFVASNELGHPE